MVHRDKDPSLKTLLLQEALKARGLYSGELDNWWGEKSESAYNSFLKTEEVGEQTTVQPTSALVDPRSEGNIATLNPVVQPLARHFIGLLSANGIDAKIISGHRTYAEQSDLYAKFKAGGPQAAPPGYSNHNFGLAFDIGIFEGPKYLEESPLYYDAGQIGKDIIGLIWGGNWTNSDEPHFEYRPAWARDMSESQALAEYRERNKQGISIV